MKKLLIMLFISSMTNAQVKTNYNDFYYDGDYLFSLLQVWEQQLDKAGEPIPLPWKVTGYIYAEITGFERVYVTDNGEGRVMETPWLKPETWSTFATINNLPSSIIMTKELETLVYLKPTQKDGSGATLVWYLRPGANYCEIHPGICGVVESVNPTLNQIGLTCQGIRFGLDEYGDFIKCLMEAKEKYEAIRLLDELLGGKQFTTRIDLYKNTFSRGIDDKGVQPYILIN